MKTSPITAQGLLITLVALTMAAANPASAEPARKTGAPGVAPIPAATENVLITWDNQRLDRLDYEAALLNNVKKEHRGEFARDMRRITNLLDDVQVRRTLSNRAIEAGLDKDPLVARQLFLARERQLANKWLEQWEAGLRVPDMTAAAEEQYKLKPEAYRVAAQVRASHVLIGLEKRGEEEARLRAEEVLAKAKAGADFATLAKEYSDDPSAKKNAGNLGWFVREKMVKPFADAAFALENNGDLSEVVKTNFGYHVILLHEKRAAGQKSFDEVKAGILAELEMKWRAEQRAAYIAEIRANKTMRLNEPAIDALLIK